MDSEISDTTKQRIKAAKTALDGLIAHKFGKNSWGKFSLEFIIEGGQLKVVHVHDHVTLK